jgi:hypothetical protein
MRSLATVLLNVLNQEVALFNLVSEKNEKSLNRHQDFSQNDNGSAKWFTENNLFKVSSGITLPKENHTLFNISSIYTDQEYEEELRKNIDINKEQNVVESNRTRYTISATIDRIKKILAGFSSNEDIDDRLYYYQAYDFQKLGLYKREDTPLFIVKLSHLPQDIIYELSTFDESTRRFVLKQAVSRIFEDINFDLYHDSISDRLEVELVK